MLFPKPERVKAKHNNTLKEQCQIQTCGRQDETLCDHHIKSKASGGSDTEDNLITVCHLCHRKIHNGKISRERLREIKQREKGLVDIGGDF